MDHHIERKPGTKRAALIEMLERPDGATMAQMTEVTGWAKSHLKTFLVRLKDEESRKIISCVGERIYRFEKPKES